MATKHPHPPEHPDAPRRSPANPVPEGDTTGDTTPADDEPAEAVPPKQQRSALDNPDHPLHHLRDA